MSEKSCRRAMLCIVCYYEKSCKGVIISQDGGSSMSEKSCRRSTLCIVCYYEK